MNTKERVKEEAKRVKERAKEEAKRAKEQEKRAKEEAKRAKERAKEEEKRAKERAKEEEKALKNLKKDKPEKKKIVKKSPKMKDSKPVISLKQKKLEDDIIIITKVMVTTLESHLPLIIESFVDDDNVLLKMSHVNNGKRIRVICPEKYNHVEELNEKTKSRFVPWSENEELASIKEMPVFIASKETKDTLIKNLWDTFGGDILKKEKARMKKTYKYTVL